MTAKAVTVQGAGPHKHERCAYRDHPRIYIGQSKRWFGEPIMFNVIYERPPVRRPQQGQHHADHIVEKRLVDPERDKARER
jgi:hypothetical protein